MAQSTFHFGFGMLCATAFTIKPVLQAWFATKGGRIAQQASCHTLSDAIARWCLWSYAIGALAVVPAVFRRLTGIEPTHPAWNIFVAYPLIDLLPLPSLLVGELFMAASLAAQYGTMLAAIYQISQSRGKRV